MCLELMKQNQLHKWRGWSSKNLPNEQLHQVQINMGARKTHVSVEIQQIMINGLIENTVSYFSTAWTKNKTLL